MFCSTLLCIILHCTLNTTTQSVCARPHICSVVYIVYIAGIFRGAIFFMILVVDRTCSHLNKKCILAKSSYSLPSAGNMVPARVGSLPIHAGNILALPRTVLHVQELSYTCRNYIQIARNCPTHAGNVPALLKIVLHVQELYADCQKVSHNCRKYSCTVLHVQKLFLHFHNISKPAGTILNFSYTCRKCENCS